MFLIQIISNSKLNVNPVPRATKLDANGGLQ
jgi:hypothetical protein